MKQTSKKPKPRSAGSSKRKVERKYTLKKEIAYRTIQGQILVLAPRAEFLYTLNDSGKFLWSALQRGASKKRLAALLAAEYDLPTAAAQRDVEAFVQVLVAKGIVGEQ